MAEEYRKPRKKSYDDSRQMIDLVERLHRFSEKRYPFLVGTLVYIFEFIMKRLAFNIKAITRANSGTRTYGLGLVVETFLLQKILMGILWLGKDFEFHYLWDLVTLDKEVNEFFWKQMVLMLNLLDIFKDGKINITFADITHFILPFGYGYVFLIASLGKLKYKAETRAGNYRENSYDFGRSIFLSEHIGKKIGTFEITADWIKLYIEPLIIIIIALILWRGLDSALGPFLLICVLASAFEDYQVYYKRWSAAQDIIDAEYEAQNLKNMLDRRKDRNTNTSKAHGKKKTAPAAFATDYDHDRYRAEMGKKSGGSGDGARLN